MTVPSQFLPAEEIQKHAGAAAASVLPDEDAETLPVPVREGGALVLLIMYFREKGRPGRRVVTPPHHAMHLDPATGKVLRFWATAPEDLGIELPTTPVPGAGVDPKMTSDAFVAKRRRLLELSPELWRAFAQGGSLDAATRALVQEYHALFLQITKKEVAPFYTGAAPDFFTWVRSAASSP